MIPIKGKNTLTISIDFEDENYTPSPTEILSISIALLKFNLEHHNSCVEKPSNISGSMQCSEYHAYIK